MKSKTQLLLLMGIFSFLSGGCGRDQKDKLPASSSPTPPKIKGSIGAERTINVGSEVTIDSKSPANDFAVVFEDDGETGYFYGLDTAREAQPILDAMSIYDVKNVTDRDKPSKFTIVWSMDGLKAALFVNDYPHAVFDFAAKRGYCRRNFPEADKKWSSHSHEWNDSAIDLFK